MKEKIKKLLKDRKKLIGVIGVALLIIVIAIICAFIMSKKQDKNVLKSLSKLLGQTDIEGQTSQIEITQKFLETQIKQAEEEKRKNEKLYSKLGTTIGLAIVIILA